MISPHHRKLRQLVTFSPFFTLLIHQKLNFQHTQKHSYTNVYMKWKKDSYLDTIDSIHDSLKLKPIIALKNCIIASPHGCIPISDVSKKGLQFDIPFKVAKFLRMYPSVFQEFTGPEYNLPWFRLTPEAVKLHNEELCVYRDFKDDLEERLVKFVLMSVENRLPLKVIKGMLWYLGLPDDYLCNVEGGLGECFEVVEMGDGLKGLTVVKSEKILSVIQKNALRSGVYSGGEMEAISIPLYPSKGLRLRMKILDWLDGFQKLLYVSPYEKYPDLYPDSDVAEKRVVGLLHELLSLFVEHSVERKRVLCLRKYLGLPQKVHKAFERHPHVFYLSLRNNTCTAILKEAYFDETAIEAHPLAEVRKKYISLVKESRVILKNRRLRNQSFCSGDRNSKMELDGGDTLMMEALEDHNPKLVYRSEVNKVAEIVCPWLGKSLKKMCKGLKKGTKNHIRHTVHVLGMSFSIATTTTIELVLKAPRDIYVRFSDHASDYAITNSSQKISESLAEKFLHAFSLEEVKNLFNRRKSEIVSSVPENALDKEEEDPNITSVSEPQQLLTTVTSKLQDDPNLLKRSISPTGSGKSNDRHSRKIKPDGKILLD